MLLLLGESGKSYRKGTIPIHTSPSGSILRILPPGALHWAPWLPREKSGALHWDPLLPEAKSREPRSPQILRQPGQNASSRRELSIGASHELSFGKCWKNNGKRITPIATSPGGSGGPCFPGNNPGNPKAPNLSATGPKRFFSARAVDWCPPRPGHPKPIAPDI